VQPLAVELGVRERAGEIVARNASPLFNRLVDIGEEPGKRLHDALGRALSRRYFQTPSSWAMMNIAPAPSIATSVSLSSTPRSDDPSG